MISEFFLNIVFNIVTGLLGLLPDISWSIDSGAFSYFLDIVRVVGYLLPAQTVYAIVSLIIAINIFKVVISLIKTVWDLLPLV